MRHQVPHRERLAAIGRDLEIEVAIDVRIEVDPAALDLLHDCGPGEQLRDRRDPKEVPVGIDRHALLGVRIAIALGEQDLAVLRSEEHTSELQSLMRISYAVFCLKKKR